MAHSESGSNLDPTDPQAPTPPPANPARPVPSGNAPPPPPPPPPKPTLAPVRRAQPVVRPQGGGTVPPAPPPVGGRPVAARDKVQESRLKSGIGSARGIFWRGEMPSTDESPHEEEEEGISVEKEAPAWLISLVIHLVLMLVLALIASPYGRRMGSIVLEMGSSNDDGDALESFELAAETPMLDDMLAEDLEPAEVEPVELPQDLFSPESLMEVAEPVQPKLDSVQIPVTGMLSGRSGASKEALLAAFGGTMATEDAVQLGLRWLARQQERAGSWSLRGPYSDGSLSENRLAATSMAMLAFQGNGHTHVSGQYKSRVEKAVKWLVEQQDRSGFMAKGLPRHQQMYAQAQATIALCELYGMTQDSWLRDPAQRALNFAQEAQSPQGGWRYQPRQDSDTSVTGWFVMALESGRAAGLEVSESKLREVSYFLDSVQHYDGAAYSYQPQRPPSKAMTAEGMLCRQYLGWMRESEAMARCVNSLSGEHIFKLEEYDYYYWYYATQVLHHYGGTPWRMWNERMREDLPAAQVKIGSEEGSWAPQRAPWGGQGGRLYTTCMAIYCLEVYYRHMPIYNVELN